MFITDGVDLPEEIMDAHANGQLVFFVGAGASMDDPSKLPSFAKLASELALAARVPYDEKMAIDLFLGSMPSDFDVHAHAHRLTSPKGSAPNPTHRALVRVASSIAPARLVTTNFDDHLSGAVLAESMPAADRWIGPALPMGDSFTGVVHLHGSVLRSPAELVLTDRDFGRAYLYDAWATRFLQKMFDSFTVLFIGYSVDDPIMRYLSLGLPSKTKRYVMTHKPDEDKWVHLGIRPISYSGTDSDHVALLSALQAWDSRARMGQLDHRARMREIVEGGTSLTPVDRDYVVRRLRTVEGATDFAQGATTVPWLKWAEDLPEFTALFRGGVQKDTASILANWFGRFVSDPELHGAALQTVQRLGQHFAPVLVDAASWSAEHLSRADEAAGRRWKTLLATSIPGYSAPADLGLLLPYEPTKRTESLAVIRAALRPFLILKRRWLMQDDDAFPPDAGVVWHANEHTLDAHLQRAIDDAEAGDQTLTALLEDALTSAYDLLSGYHGDRTFDSLGFGRSAIEPHGQDRHPDPEDALIDALRDFGVKSLSVVPGLADRWWLQERSLFRRLALHLLAVDESKSVDHKLRWILDRDLLYALPEKHETYQVLAKSLPNASAIVREQVLAAALFGPDYPHDMSEREKHVSYSTFNLLAWLTQSAPEWEEASSEFARMQAANLSFGVRENPDFDKWSSSGTWGGRLPIAPEDFIRDADTDLKAAFDALLAEDYSERNFEEPTWDDALSVIRRVSEIRPTMGIDLWDLVEDRADLGERAAQLKRAMVGGWEKAELEDEAEPIVALVASETGTTESARSISQFLLAQIHRHVESDESAVVSGLRQIAIDLWSAHSSGFEHGPDSQPSSLSLNSWPGEVASYWAVEVDRRWRHQREDWDGLNEQESAAILELINGPEATRDAARPSLASSAFFLFAADPQFIEENLLPLFSADASARQMWGAFLYNPRANDGMLAAGLLDGLLFEWARLDEIGDHGLPSQFFDFAASVAILASLTVADRQRVLDQSVLAANGMHAPDFASAVVHLLDSSEVESAGVWDRWLRDHLTARLTGLPRTAQPEELARWADAVPFLGDRIPAAIEILRDSSIGFGEQYNVPDFPQGVLTNYGPAFVEHFTERVRNSLPGGWQVPHAVAELISGIREVIGDAAVQPIVDAAREQGFSPIVF